MPATKGNCFICGKTVGKTAIKNHILKEHNGDEGPGFYEKCYLFKAEGAYDKGYWLFFSVSCDADLSDVDQFLRNIWCECCEHLSRFTAKRYEIDMETYVSRLGRGTVLNYSYDFGSTTEIIVTVVDVMERPRQKKSVQLLARNVLPEHICDECGAPATYIDVWDYTYYCAPCAEKNGDEDGLMPVVNSPRSGVCGYDGAQDIWTFDPNKPFPQP